jgi:hypothetical protein
MRRRWWILYLWLEIVKHHSILIICIYNPLLLQNFRPTKCHTYAPFALSGVRQLWLLDGRRSTWNIRETTVEQT